jgi:tol-pal system beta propeller repeat protein TolB
MPRRRARKFWNAGLPVLLMAALCWPVVSAAQDEAPLPPPSTYEDPARDILIEGIGFSKLILQVDTPSLPRGIDGVKEYLPLLERDLCWSGLFTLHDAVTRHCRPRGTPSRVDMRLRFAGSGKTLVVRVQDAGPEGLVLYEEAVDFTEAPKAHQIMALVNRIVERISGEPGILGSTIAYVLRQPGYAKVIVGTNTHGEQPRLISQNQDISLLPHWSPTGNSIVYTVLGRNGTGVFLQSMLKEAAEEGNRFLTAQTGLNSGGAFSPDESRIAITMSLNGTADLYELTFKTRQLRRLTFRDGIETSADWSPKGNELSFVSDRSGTPQVYLLNLETLEDLRLTFDSGYNADPKFSPDGESILFTKRVNGRDQIHIMDRFGENVRAVTLGNYDSEQAEWSPDGKQIVFTSNRTGVFKLYVVSADGTALRRLTRSPEQWQETSPSWTRRLFSR